MPVNPRTPVLVGYGQVNHREADAPENTPGSGRLDGAAAREAADARVLEAVDSIRVVNLLSAHYRDPGLLLGQRIGADRSTTRYSGIGGNVPQSLVNRACLDIQHGRADVVLVAGAEMWRTRMQLRANGQRLGLDRAGRLGSAARRQRRERADGRAGRRPHRPRPAGLHLPDVRAGAADQHRRVGRRSPQAHRRIVGAVQRGGGAATRMPGFANLLQQKRFGRTARRTG